MTTSAPREEIDLLDRVHALEQKNDWHAIAAFADRLPAELDGPALTLADAVAFALGQLKRFDAAIALVLRAWRVDATYRRATALAYLHYAASLALVCGRDGRHGEAARRANSLSGDREALRRGFRAWIAEALTRAPSPIKDLYRLGIFEAQVESMHDKAALRAFLGVVRAYRALPEAERRRRHDYVKYVVRALYAGGRSALRLGEVALARKLSFDCLRLDAERHHVAPIHKLTLAGKVCLAAGELDHAERAFRLALDAKGPPRRDFLHGFLAEVARRRGAPGEGAAWLDRHVRADRRDATHWRQLGALRAEAGDGRGAENALRAALNRDRGGRHLTLVLLGDVLRDRGDVRSAERCYRDAAEFKRRRWSSEDRVAAARLAELASLSPGPTVAKTSADAVAAAPSVAAVGAA